MSNLINYSFSVKIKDDETYPFSDEYLHQDLGRTAPKTL